MISWLLLYLLLGAFAGLMAGLLGVGGGLVIVPVLAFVFAQQGVAEPVIMHLAIGTSLATIVFTSLSSVHAHHRHGAVLWPVFWQLLPGIVMGALFGAWVADRLATTPLRIFFALFEFYVAVQLTLNIRPAPHRVLPGRAGLFGAGGMIGTVSSLVGIGGGTLTVPFLLWCNVAMRQAVGTSAACGLPIAVAGSLGFVIAGWDETGLPSGSTGYVYWPAFAGIVAASILTAPLGARLAQVLPAATLKRIFAGLLVIFAVKMVVN